MPMTERYIWTVTYRDGATLEEYPDPDTHRSFTEVRVGDVVRLEVRPNPWLMETGPTYTVLCHPDEGVRPVMFRTVALNMQSGESARWHVFGFQVTANGKNVKSLTYLPDHGGSVTIADRRLEVAT